jgi:hypothetical protein
VGNSLLAAKTATNIQKMGKRASAAELSRNKVIIEWRPKVSKKNINENADAGPSTKKQRKRKGGTELVEDPIEQDFDADDMFSFPGEEQAPVASITCAQRTSLTIMAPIPRSRLENTPAVSSRVVDVSSNITSQTSGGGTDHFAELSKKLIELRKQVRLQCIPISCNNSDQCSSLLVKNVCHPKNCWMTKPSKSSL